MYRISKLPVAVTFIIVCSFTSVANAQRASDKPVNQFFSKKEKEKLDEKNKSNGAFNRMNKEENLPSNKSSVQDITKLKNKNIPKMTAHSSFQSVEEKQKQLPSNSAKLKQLETTAIKPSKSHKK